MSQPASPTRVNRNAVFACGVAQPHVAKQRNHSTGADTDPVNRGDDRLRAGTHGLHEIPGHARELEQTLHVPVQQRPNDIAHIASGAEISAIRTEDHGLDVVCIGESAESIAQLGIRFESDRVLSLTALERDDRNVPFATPVEMCRLEILHFHGLASRARTHLTSLSS